MKSPLAPLAILAGFALSFATAGLAQDAQPAPAPEPSIGGDTITEQNQRDIAEMIRIADAIDSAVDAKDWRAARSFFEANIIADFNSLDGSAPGPMTSQQLVNGWASNLTENKTSFHMRSNHRVTFFSETEAVMLSHGYAWNRLLAGAEPENGNDAFWEVWGNYTHAFVRTSKGWKVNGIKMEMTAERGNPYVRNTPGS